MKNLFCFKWHTNLKIKIKSNKKPKLKKHKFKWSKVKDCLLNNH